MQKKKSSFSKLRMSAQKKKKKEKAKLLFFADLFLKRKCQSDCTKKAEAKTKIWVSLANLLELSIFVGCRRRREGCNLGGRGGREQLRNGEGVIMEKGNPKQIMANRVTTTINCVIHFFFFAFLSIFFFSLLFESNFYNCLYLFSMSRKKKFFENFLIIEQFFFWLTQQNFYSVFWVMFWIWKRIRGCNTFSLAFFPLFCFFFFFCFFLFF